MKLRQLLEDAVGIRLRADVPVSVQLSGGLDSSTVLALAASMSSEVRSFTVSFSDAERNEESFARRVVERYGNKVDYHVIQPEDDDMLNDADEVVHLMGEPFHSPNQITSHRVWNLIARQGIRVNLYGTAGDEVLAGYGHVYFYAYLRKLLARGRIGRFINEMTSFSERDPGRFGGDYLRRTALVLPSGSSIYKKLSKGISAASDPFVRLKDVRETVGPSNELHQLMIEYLTDWQMNQWLRIDNQNSMGVPLELRAPFLDYRIVEFAYTLPTEYLIRDGWMKWLLRHAMEDLLPTEVVWRKIRMGFPFPLGAWLGRRRHRILSMTGGLDCPYLDTNKLETNYEVLRLRDPGYLWRLISLAFWWKRCIQCQPLC